MDLKIHRSRGMCARTGRYLVPGEPMVSALVREGGSLERIDCSAEVWEGPSDNTLAWWRSLYTPKEVAGPSLAPADVLLDVLEELESCPEDAALRYLIALQLVRRRVLRITDASVVEEPRPSDGREMLVLACRKRHCEYQVATVPADEATAKGVEQRLRDLLWSGGEA